MKFKKTIATTLAAALFASSAVAGQTEAAAKNFSDVKNSDWYANSVQKLVQFNIISGYGDNTFKPHQAITRGQAATILARALELDLSNVENPKFKDVPTTHSSYGAIAALTELGVFKKNDYFNPNNQLTRAQMAQILVLAFDLEATNKKTFNDVKSTDWSAPYIGTIGALNITTNSGTFEPQKSVSRAHITAFIERIINHKRSDYTYDIWDNWADWETTPTNIASNPTSEQLEEYIEDDWNDKSNSIDYTDDDDDWDLDDDDWDLDWDLEEYEPDIEDTDDSLTTPTKLTDPEMASYVFDLEKNTKDLNNAIIRLKADIKDYKEVERSKEASKDDVEDVLDDIDSSQLHMKRMLERANLLLKDVAKIQQTTAIANAKKELERKVTDATAELNTSKDTVVDIESLQDDMEDAVKDVLKEIQRAEQQLLREGSDVEDLEEAYDDLAEEVKVAKKLLDHTNTSKVAVVRGLKSELDKAVKDAEDVMKDLLDKIGDLETDFEDATERMIKRLRELADLFNEAVSKKESANITYYKKKLLEKIDEAEDLIDDMEHTKLNKVKPYIKDLEEEIEDMERFIDKAEKRI
ncbi:MAG: S-layer homology domain-containing protein [Solibacillus sp.]